MTSSRQFHPQDASGLHWNSGWSGRFRRSCGDRRIAGVAGGIGRALRVDPVLIRVTFAVLTIFGGAGIALYALCWLLLPSDKDTASPAEALLGHGHSSVPAPLTILLGLVVLASATSMFTWGLHLLPIAIAAIVVFAVVGRRRERNRRYQGNDRVSQHLQQFADRAGHWGDQVGRRAGSWGDDFGRKAERWGNDIGNRAERWGRDFGHRGGGATDQGRTDRSSSRGTVPSASPFERPAFWDDETRRAAPGFGAPAESAIRLTKDASTLTGGTSAAPEASDQPAGRATPEPSGPPAWDPLGAAPFAWDLPEPGPAPASPAEQGRGRAGRAIGRATTGIALMVAAVLALGLSLQWWQIGWAVISASALAVVAVGLFFSAVTGRRRSNLIGLGILLSAATLFLTLTGLNGTGGIGERHWIPTSTKADQNYRLQAGDATLDLSQLLPLKPGERVTMSVDLKVGHLAVLVPTGVNVEASCSLNLGSMQCLAEQSDGWHNQRISRLTAASPKAGTIELDAKVGVGSLEVRSDG
ncbi:MAG: PspC domain-containing protein [Actinomycetota bacterium]|nr:PspC domain-containing protein [Actinomycetota bacterium]